VQICSTDDGIKIRFKPHPENADSPRIETLLSVSNVTFERCQHELKHRSEIISIDEGIQTDRSEVHSNADVLRIEIRQDDANLTDEIE
jgi:hypothetical protein